MREINLKQRDFGNFSHSHHSNRTYSHQDSHKPYTSQTGSGFADTLKSIYTEGSKVASYLYKNKDAILDAYTGPVSTAIRNAIPASDSNARSGFAGELHTVLQLPNGRPGIANFMGPNTHISERIRRGDPPRTMVDRVAQAHDIRYALSNNVDDIRRADNAMIKKVDELGRNNSDSRINLLQAKAIYAKTLAEDTGMLAKGSFSKFKDGAPTKSISDSDKSLLQGKLSNLEAEGFGMHPGDALKLKLLKKELKSKKSKKQSGKGDLVDLVVGKIIPSLMETLGIKNPLSPQKMKSILNQVLAISKSNNLGDQVGEISKVVLEILLSTIQKKGYGVHKKINKKVLVARLKKGMMNAIKHHQKGKGAGMRGHGWWDDFYSGFKMVFKPGAMVLGTVADALGQPEIGIPLQIISGLM